MHDEILKGLGECSGSAVKTETEMFGAAMLGDSGRIERPCQEW